MGPIPAAHRPLRVGSIVSSVPDPAATLAPTQTPARFYLEYAVANFERARSWVLKIGGLGVWWEIPGVVTEIDAYEKTVTTPMAATPAAKIGGSMFILIKMWL